MRLFVAVQPPEDVLDQVSELVTALRETGSAADHGDDVAGMRWTSRTQWHVTLRFLGEVTDPAEALDALDGARPALPPPAEATLGPKVELLGRSVICVRVAGLDDLARVVTEATTDVGEPPDDSRPFRGHLTLARLPRRQRVRAEPWVGYPIFARWPVNEIHVVRSHLHHDGSRYEVLSTMPLTRGAME